MKAMVYTRYGPPDVLQLREVERPEPGDDQVLVKVFAASANALDYRRFVKLSTAGRLMEAQVVKSVGKTLGADISGVVEAVGARVTQFQPGDEVFGISAGSMGGFAEYTCASENHLALKPAVISFDAAAAAPTAALTALQGLRDKGRIQSGQKVLICGASGGVGTFAVQIAKSFDAEVTAVCSQRNLEMARFMGADRVIDYSQEDFTKDGQRYDLIIAINGYHPILDYQHVLTPYGILVILGGSMTQILQGMLVGQLLTKIGRKKMGFMGIAKINQKDLVYIGDLLETGKIEPVIDRYYPLNEIPAAISYLAEGHAKGKIVITMGNHTN